MNSEILRDQTNTYDNLSEKNNFNGKFILSKFNDTKNSNNATLKDHFASLEIDDEIEQGYLADIEFEEETNQYLPAKINALINDFVMQDLLAKEYEDLAKLKISQADLEKKLQEILTPGLLNFSTMKKQKNAFSKYRNIFAWLLAVEPSTIRPEI